MLVLLVIGTIVIVSVTIELLLGHAWLLRRRWENNQIILGHSPSEPPAGTRSRHGTRVTV